MEKGVYEVSSRPIRFVRKIGRTGRTTSTRRDWVQGSWRGYDYAETYSPTYRDYYIPVCGAGGGGVPLNSGGDGREGAARDGPSSAEGAEGVAEDLEPAHRQSAVRVRYTHRNYMFAQRTRSAPSAPDQPAIKRLTTENMANGFNGSNLRPLRPQLHIRRQSLLAMLFLLCFSRLFRSNVFDESGWGSHPRMF